VPVRTLFELFKGEEFSQIGSSGVKASSGIMFGAGAVPPASVEPERAHET